MSASDLFSEFRRGRFTAACAGEAEYKAAWLTIPATGGPWLTALHAGLLADRLSWVFIGGYQSAVRACFDGLPAGAWISFCVSEDRSGRLRGTSLNTQDPRAGTSVSGTKTWVAACNAVDYLVVTVSESVPPVCLLINRQAAGVTLTPRMRAGFLSDMSQGSATFHRVVVDAADFLGAQRIGDFALAEPFFILTAAGGFLMREGLRLGLPELSENAMAEVLKLEQLAAGDFTGNLERLLEVQDAFVGLGKHGAELAMAAEGWQAQDWSRNGRLLGMYRRALRSRVGAIG